MIGTAINHVASQLNQHLQLRLGETQSRVVLSPLFEQDGTVPNRIDNMLVCLLVNIEKDAIARSSVTPKSGRPTLASPPSLHLNLHLLIAANFGDGNYTEALSLISDTASFFQGRPVMTHTDSPELDPRIERLSMEIENLSIPELSNLWGMLGGRYLPSILYKMRMVTIDSSDVTGVITPVSRPSAQIGGNLSE